jgi:hypothetical protein
MNFKIKKTEETYHVLVVDDKNEIHGSHREVVDFETACRLVDELRDFTKNQVANEVYECIGLIPEIKRVL